jgi:hypothetical protein
MKTLILRRLIGLTTGLLLASSAAFAANFTVNTTTDSIDAKAGDGACADASGKCSLRAAVIESNASVGADSINLPAGAYVLQGKANEDNAASGDLDIKAGEITIKGAGAGQTSIDGGANDRHFDVFAGGSLSLADFTLKNGKSTPADGSSASQTEGGGAIRGYEANVTLSKMVLEGNQSPTFGGAVAFQYAPFGRPKATGLKIVDSVFNGNTATVNGGALIVAMGAIVEISGSSFSKNRAGSKYGTYGSIRPNAYGGGGLFIGQGYRGFAGDVITNVKISNSTFDDNLSSDRSATNNISGNAWGGALHMEGFSVATVSGSTFKNNKSDSFAGA